MTNPSSEAEDGGGKKRRRRRRRKKNAAPVAVTSQQVAASTARLGQAADDEQWKALLQELLPARFWEIFDWMASSSNMTHKHAAEIILRAAVSKAKPEFREAKGQVQGTTRKAPEGSTQ
jgi:hypothetical protein